MAFWGASQANRLPGRVIASTGPSLADINYQAPGSENTLQQEAGFQLKERSRTTPLMVGFDS